MGVAVHNLLVLAEDMLVMWALVNLAVPKAVEVRVVPDARRNPRCPVKYRIQPSDTLLAGIVKAKAPKTNS
jgi:hypothetical protein